MTALKTEDRVMLRDLNGPPVRMGQAWYGMQPDEFAEDEIAEVPVLAEVVARGA